MFLVQLYSAQTKALPSNAGKLLSASFQSLRGDCSRRSIAFARFPGSFQFQNVPLLIMKGAQLLHIRGGGVSMPVLHVRVLSR